MNARTRILLLFDNNGSEYVSRITDAVSRAARTLGFPIESENLFSTAGRAPRSSNPTRMPE
jgi:hypothetical protein